jgi:CheY-like chemotaxis protein
MTAPKTQLQVVIAEDDEDDILLMRKALESIRFDQSVVMVPNGDELLQHLKNIPTLPAFVILDLNMPIKNGRQTLIELRETPAYKMLPVIVMSTSRSPVEIRDAYEHGANSFITKPNRFEDLVRIMQFTMTYWLTVVQLPAHSPQ